MLDARHLRILLTVVRCGSFSAAARALNMSQPAVSMLIAQLEDRVGARLVERGRQGARATRAGEILARRAEMLERVLEQAEEEVALGSQDVLGPVAIGGTPGALMSLLPKAIATLQAQGMRAAFRVLQATDGDLNEMLRDHSIDLAICTVGIGSLPEDIVERTITEDRFVLVMRADHPLQASVARLEELVDADWVLPSDGGAFQRQIEAMFLGAGVRIPTHGVRSDALAVTREIIRCSDHLNIAPIDMVRADVEAGVLRVIPLASALQPRSVGVRMVRDRRQAELTEMLIAAMARNGVPPVRQVGDMRDRDGAVGLPRSERGRSADDGIA